MGNGEVDRHPELSQKPDRTVLPDRTPDGLLVNPRSPANLIDYYGVWSGLLAVELTGSSVVSLRAGAACRRIRHL